MSGEEEAWGYATAITGRTAEDWEAEYARRRAEGRKAGLFTCFYLVTAPYLARYQSYYGLDEEDDMICETYQIEHLIRLARQKKATPLVAIPVFEGEVAVAVKVWRLNPVKYVEAAGA